MPQRRFYDENCDDGGQLRTSEHRSMYSYVRLASIDVQLRTLKHRSMYSYDVCMIDVHYVTSKLPIDVATTARLPLSVLELR